MEIKWDFNEKYVGCLFERIYEKHNKNRSFEW